MVVDEAAVGGGASYDDLGAVEGGELVEFGVVDHPGSLVEAVGKCFEVFGDHGDFLGGGLVPVGEVAAMWEVKTHYSIVGCTDGRVGV